MYTIYSPPNHKDGVIRLTKKEAEAKENEEKFDGKTDGFCLVSSDSDYTGLAKRIREEGLFVMGIGRRTTPIAFVQSCEIFTFCENLVLEMPKIVDSKKIENKHTKKGVEKLEPIVKEKGKKEEFKKAFPKLDLTIIDKAFDISTNEEEEILISKVGLSLRKIDPSFDPRTYGYKNLTQLFENIEKYKVLKNEVNGLNHPLVKLK